MRRLVTIERPKAATPPYVASPVAAPNPVIKPFNLPSAIVLRMHRTPIGPTGMAMLSPMMSPLVRRSNCVEAEGYGVFTS
jgi:hypothetical protein